jgi:transaldolase/glucose-6-phosphate isomerase
MERLLNKQGDLSRVASVASVFVSRVDTTVDKMLDGSMAQTADDTTKSKLRALQGKAAVAYAHLIYKKHLDIFSDKTWGALREKGANLQRVLWGSTGTKNPAYSDIKYVTELIAKNTVNTLPQNTLEAYRDHGAVKEALTAAADESQRIVDDLGQFDIDMNSVCAKLLEDGAAAFTKSFTSLLTTLETKAKETSAKA